MNAETTVKPNPADKPAADKPIGRTHDEEVKQREADAAAEGERENVKVNAPDAPEEIKKQHDLVEQNLAKLNEENEEGHAVNMEKIEKEAEAAQNNPNHVPTGKEVNRNTPRIDKHGNKIWD